MKKINYLIFLASLLLLAILMIQLNWIFETARIKQEIFNDKANMILIRTTEVIASDENTCKGIENGISEIERKTIDSIFNYYMQLYNLKIDYVFELSKNNSFKEALLSNAYQQSIESSMITGDVVLRLILPERSKYIFAELKSSLFASVLLVILVILLFWKSFKSLLTEKQIALNTYEYLSNMMHEFKTPITNISMSLKLLKKSENSRERTNGMNYIEIIQQENDKLKQQVELALNYSALDKGIIKLNKTEINLHTLIENIFKQMDLQIQSEQVQVSLNLLAEMDRVMVDELHFNNVLINFIDNAIKYSNHPKYLEVNTVNEDDSIVLSIKDRGIGMQKKYHNYIFDAYFRVPTGDVHNVKGFGLGLSYVKKIIDLHKAEISFDSAPSKGSTFSIRIKNA